MHTGEDEIAVAGNTFTITSSNGASLRGTVVYPADATVTSGARRIVVTPVGGKTDGFSIVMTVQMGPAPKVVAAGGGRGQSVGIDGQRVKLDGETLRLSQDR